MKLEKVKFHFIGIGGIGMCGLAELLHTSGAIVTGSDAAENANTDRLKQLGLKVLKGHTAENVNGADVVVYSSAIPVTNPEFKEAKAQSIPLIPRAEALAEIMRIRRGIAIAGTHGKTTTTSMTASIFLEANQSPTIVVGGRFEKIKSTAQLGKGDWLIAEADESDGSFNKLSPEFAIITNIDSDHMDHFKSFENLKKAFLDFSYRVPFYGLVIVFGDDPVIRKVFEGFNKRILFFGFDSKNDYVLSGENGQYSLTHNDLLKNKSKTLGQFKIKIPGRHNALNATAAIIAAMSAGISFETSALGIENFGGVDRRFHFKGESRQIKVYDDYGHHPTEVRATLQAMKEKYPQNRLVVYFQPHRYSRTEHCWQDFKTCFSQADVLFLGEIYAAGESPIPGVSSEILLNEINRSHKFLSTKTNPAHQQIENIISQLKPNDIFLTLGAGDGWKLGLSVLESLK